MPGGALPGGGVLLGTVGAKAVVVDAEEVAVELTGAAVGTTSATVRLGASLLRVMPRIVIAHRMANIQGSTLCGVGLAAFLRPLASRIKIPRATTADRLRNQTVIAEL
jgi:hypothetical protein